MNAEQYQALLALPEPAQMVYAHQLSDQTPRTLIYGYDVDRNTFHVYLDEKGRLVQVRYDIDGILLDSTQGTSLAAEQCRPNKRAYPEACDFEMSQVMHVCGQPLCFTNFNAIRTVGRWYGKRFEDLLPASMREQLKFSVPVTIDELGLKESGVSDCILYSRDFGDAFTKSVQDAVDAQLTGLVRAVRIRGESRETANRWLENIPGAIAHRVLDASGLTEWKMPEAAAAALVLKLTNAADAHLGS